MNIRKFKTAIVLCIATFSIFGSSASAVSANDWRAGRIIDDSVFTDSGSMSVAQIQSFLNSKVPTCDTNGTQSTTRWNASTGKYYTRAEWGATQGHPAPYTCLKDYYEVAKTQPGSGIPSNNYGSKPIPAGAKSAAQLIWDAANANRISPKVLLTTIQKESSGPLTVDDWPYESQYTYAMGAHCPDGPNGAQCDPNYAGFSIQINESASLFRYYLDNMNQPWWPFKKPGNNVVYWNIPATGCGSANIKIENNATAALYTYTPYQPNQAALSNLYGSGDGCSAYGNRNFWRIYNDWFGDTLYRGIPYAHPDGTLIQYTGSPTVYLIENGIKRPFLTEQSLYSYGYNAQDITSATYYDAFLYQGSPVPLFRPGTLIKGSGQTIYSFQLNTNGVSGKQYFNSWQDFSGLGYELNKVMTVPDSIIDQIGSFGAIDALHHASGDIIKDPNSNAIYYLSNENKRYVFNSADAFTSHRLTFSDAKTATMADMNYPLAGTIGFREGTLVKSPGSPAIFVTDNVNNITVRRALSTWNCFEGFGYKLSEDVFNTSTELINTIPIGQESCNW